MAGLKFTIAADNSPAIRALSELTTALGKVNNAFKSTKKAAGKGSGGAFDPKELNAIGAELKNVTGIIRGMGIATNQWERGAGIKSLKTGFDDINDSARNLYKTVSGLLAPVLTLSGAGIMYGLGNIAKGFGDRATGITKATYETGVGAESLQKMQNRNQMFGISPEQTNAGFPDFAQNLRQIALYNAGGLQSVIENQLGISLKDKKGNFLYNTPGGLESLQEKVISAISEKGEKNPLMRDEMIEKFKLSYLKPALMRPHDDYMKQINYADNNLYRSSSQDLEKGNINALKWNEAVANFSASVNRFGAAVSPLWGFMLDSFNSMFDPKPSARVDLSRGSSEWVGIGGSDNGWGMIKGGAPASPPSPGGSAGWGLFDNKEDNTANGIFLNAPAPPDNNTTITVEFNNMPLGAKVKTSPSPSGRVQPKINYSTMDGQ